MLYLGQCRYENKKNESDYADCKNNGEENICQLCDEVQQPEDETIKNGFQHEELKGAQKLPKYFDNLSYAEGSVISKKINIVYFCVRYTCNIFVFYRTMESY